MKLKDLSKLHPQVQPEWKLKLQEFWLHASDAQRLDMQFMLKLGDRAGATALLESWSTVVEKKKKKKKSKKSKTFRYGSFGGWFYPGLHNNSGADTSSDGADGGGESIQEQSESQLDIVRRFAKSCAEYLKLKNVPEIKLRRDPEWTRRHGTFGRYTADPHNRIELATSGRHIVDILRTLAHEMTHAAQNERIGLPDHAGETGSEFEDGANATAGRIMRHWAESDPEIFQGAELDESWRKAASAAAAAACIAGTPGCATTGTTAADALRTIQTIGRTAQNLPTRAGAEEELMQRVKDELRRRQGQVVPEDYSPDDPPKGMKKQKTDPTYNVVEGSLTEFAPSDDGDSGDDGFSDDTLKQLAAQWYNGDEDPQVERTLAMAGWEIGQDEGYDDEPGVFVVMTGDEHGRSYMSWPAHELKQGVAESTLNEYRNALYDFVKSKFPTWPEYVLKDFLYAQAKGIRDKEELKDFLDRNQKDFGQVKWRLEKLPITLDIFTPKTQRMIKQREGGSSNPMQVPKDAERHAQQLKMIQQQGVRTEPIIVAKLNNGYDLIEGWHRTIQHLQQYPEGYTGPAWVAYGATYTSESKQGVAEGLHTDVPNEEWLNGKIEYAKKKGRDRYGVPYMGSTTAWARDVQIPVDILKRLPGMKGEQSHVRQQDLDWLVNYMGTHNRLPPFSPDNTEEYKPFINVAWNGEAWVNEGNHRIMAAAKLGWKNLPIQISYFDGGERVKSGAMYPSKIGLGNLAESSGYIPTDAEKNDPRFSMALTRDIRPGETGRQANKLGLKTDSQGRPSLLMKRLGNLLESIKNEDRELVEVDMSPTSLRKWAQSPASEGIQVGIEYEFIFPDTRSADEDDDPYSDGWDLDMDERAYSIRDIVEFFRGGDMGISTSEARQLTAKLEEEFFQWVDESFDENWGLEEFVSWMWENAWDDLQDELANQAREEFEEAGKEPTDSQIEDRARDLFRDRIADEWNEDGEYLDDARDEAREEYMQDVDQEDFLRSQGITMMSDVANLYDVDFPYYAEKEQYGNESWDRWANKISQVVEMPVFVSSSYHSASRRPGQWIMEPDSSLDPDSPEDAGIELISPPLPLPQALATLSRLQTWAKENDVYTNDSTGLHMNISIPKSAVDYVKLIMFMGDQHVLDQFGRAANHYASSAFKKISQNVAYNRSQSKLGEQEAINRGPVDINTAMEMMRNSLIELAGKYVQNSVGSDKYTSAHVKSSGDNTYIEFRGPGGDWVDRSPGQMADTVLRLARAMTIAGDPDAERKEYGKKLYKMLTPEDPDQRSSMKLFADYSAGTISKEELKRTWAEKVLRAQRQGRDRTAEAEYDIIDSDTGEVIDTFSAVGDQDAVDKAHDRWSGKGINYRLRLHDREAALSPNERRRSELAQRVAGKPIWWRVSDKDENYTGYVQAPTAAKAIDNFMQQEPEAMRISRDQFEVQPKNPPPGEEPAARPAARPSAADLNALPPGESDFMVTWDEFRTHEGREVRVSDALRTTARTAAEAARRVHDSLQMQGREAFNVNAEPTEPPAWRRNREMPAAATDNITNPLHQTD